MSPALTDAETCHDRLESIQNLPENQCIFIRGFRVILFSKILPLLRGAAGPAQLPGEGDPDPDPQGSQLNSIPAETRVSTKLFDLTFLTLD